MKIWIDEVTVLIFFLFPFWTYAQSGSYTDPGQAYNRLLLEKNTNSYYRIGNYKVIGSPYLFGEDEIGSIYSPSGSLQNIKVRYNTHSQQLEASAEHDGSVLFKDVNDADSFVLLPSKNHVNSMVFINKKLLNARSKGFFLEVYKGMNFSLYKDYNSDLAIVPTNYVQADLRQFELNYNYYYDNDLAGGTKLLKPTESYLKKEFKGKIDMNEFLNRYGSLSQEEMLKQFFATINE